MLEQSKIIRLCFYARAGQLDLFVKIAKKIETENVKCFFVTQNKEESNFVKSKIENAKIYEIEKFLTENWNTKSNCDLQDIGVNIEDLNLWRMLYTDRFLVNYSLEDCKKMIYLHFLFFNELFQNEKPRFFFNEAIAIFSSFVAFELGKRYQCEYVGFIIARDDAENKFFFVTDLHQRNKEMEYHYFNSSFTNEELNKAKLYLEDFRAKPSTPAYMLKNGKKPKFTWKMPLYPIKYLLYKNQKCFTQKVSYMTYNNAFRIINEPILQYVMYLRSINLYQKPVMGEKFYLFPLHFQPEASTLVCATKYEKQLFAIDNIAKSIPSGTMLYVKEHYSGLGHRDIYFYKELQKYPNVRLINPYTNIHDLIKSSLACVVLTNTTGFEAILHGKKTFVLGEVFYDFFENAVKISDVYIEYEKLKNYDTCVNDSDILKFICSYKRSLYDGCVHPIFDKFITDLNVDNLIKSFKEFNNRRRKLDL